MARAVFSASLVGVATLLALGCSLGGQTYDDGSDEVRGTRPSSADDAGVGGASSEPEPEAGGAPGEPEPGAGGAPGEPEPEAGGAPGEPEPDGAATCDSLEAEVRAEVEALRDGATVSCVEDSDCIEVTTAPSCIDSCRQTALVNADGVAAVTRGVEDLSDTLCQEFFEAQCEVELSPCAPEGPLEPRCSDGTCRYVEVDLASCDQLAADASSTIRRELDELDVTCNLDADCLGIDLATCLDACGKVVIGNAEAIAALPARIGDACADFEVAACMIESEPCLTIEPDTSAHCSGGRCVPGAASADCYGPERNLDQAYAGTLPGCPCDDSGGLCDGPVALVCTEGNWQAVEDGPCDPAVREQDCDGRLDSSELCVELFDTCFDLSTGRFCGVGRRTSLCDDGQIVPDSGDCLQDDAFCVELENGAYCTGSDAGGSISEEQCGGRGGEVIAGPGAESFTECPDGRATLAVVDGCFEGCLCCGFEP